MLTAAATGVVVIHHPLLKARLLGRHSCADRDHDAARLVAGDHWLGAAVETRAGIPSLESGAVDVEVAATHARSLYLEHHVARAGRGIGKVAQLELPVTDKHDAFHATLPSAPSITPMRRPASSSLPWSAREARYDARSS